MKFGAHLEANMREDWREFYLCYNELKKMLKALSVHGAASPDPLRATSLSSRAQERTPMTATFKGRPIVHEDFLRLLDDQMEVIASFTAEQVAGVRGDLRALEEDVDRMMERGADEILRARLRERAEAVGAAFLELEKYVNLNYKAYHKILKKHDKHLRAVPCKALYLSKLHNQPWVKGDYSDVFVRLSSVHSSLRGDHQAVQVESEAQEFVRSTTKYWVRTDDVSAVKHMVLQHLPVFLQPGAEESSDAQLTNSVYLDNSTLELYHGRLNKTPGAIAVRLRWYGNQGPQLVFVERKTHRESWTGNESVKERFIVQPDEVMSLLEGTWTKDAELARMRAKGVDEALIAEWETLADEVCRAINSKQLVPTMRTQYMRTAFQIPFDARVRVSLDTSLTMFCENPGQDRWFRDPDKPMPRDEIIYFPHAVLEVKLQLDNEDDCPGWVTELIESGLLTEVHKFSKFVHGCATLMHDDVQAVPYWVDDLSLRDSILSANGAILRSAQGAIPSDFKQLLRPRTEEDPSSREGAPLLHEPQAGAPVRANGYGSVNTGAGAEAGPGALQRCWDGCGDLFSDGCPGCLAFTPPATALPPAGQKIEPKVYFAAERTFLKWLHMAVTLSSMSLAILAFSGENRVAQVYALLLLPVAVAFCVYALNTYHWRVRKISQLDPGPYDDRVGPVFLTILLMVALFLHLLLKVFDYLG